MADLRALTARLTAFETRIADLEAELARVRAGRIRSMRETHRCPACGGGHLLRVPGLHPLHEIVGWATLKRVGPIQHFVCCSCMLIESHAIDLEGITSDGERIVEIRSEPEPDPAGGPFR